MTHNYKVQHYRTILAKGNTAVEQMVAIAWAPNNQKLAAAGKDKVIYLYDETGEQRDRFQTRAADTKKGSTYSVSSIAFSPDSTKLAVAQTDGIIFLYKIGKEFKLKKSISNKIMQPFGVLKVLWPNEFEIISGLMDGKLRHTPLASSSKGLRSRTFYNPESQIVALVSNTKQTLIASSHLDGKIAVFGLGEADLPTTKYVVQNPLPAFAIAFGGVMLLAGSCDSRIIVYDQGKVRQLLDFSHVEADRDFVSATGSPSGLAVAFGGFDRIRLIRWVPRKKTWEEGPLVDMKNLYTVTSMAWNNEGTSLATGSMVGALHLFETVIRKSRNDRYEISYATPYHAVLTMANPPQKAHLKSMYKLEILEIRIVGHDRFAIANTLETMLICDIYRDLTSEIRWEDIDDNEKFYFENPNGCMIFNNGEMTLVEYGQHKPLGTFRTEFANPHLVSLRINERLRQKDADTKQNKKLAYLIDLQTVTIIDLFYNTALGHINHDAKIDWLELNETGSKLLFRDRKLRLYLVDVLKMEKTAIMHMCNFVQWVPSSDVIVAQNKLSLSVWYNVDNPGECVELEARGLAFEVVRSPKETLILVQDGTIVHQVPLDTSRIEFGTAILDGDLLRAMLFLEVSEFKGDKSSMWKQLSREALEAQELKIAERASYASGDIARGKYISNTIKTAEQSFEKNLDETVIANELNARISVLNGDLKTAEYILLENDNIEGAIHLYTKNHKWKEAMRLASEKHFNNIGGLVRAHLLYLMETGQDEAAAEFLEENGNIEMAAVLFWSNGMPMKAARLIEMHYSKMQFNSNLIQRIGESLQERNLFIEAAEYFDAVGNVQNACENYKKSNHFEQAVRIAKKHFPNLVVTLEEEWANYLEGQKLYDLACNHYVEAGKLRMALDAAIAGRKWEKALQIIDVIDDPRTVSAEYVTIGEYYSSVDDNINAEKCFLKAGHAKRAVEMYLEKEKWQEAFALGSRIPTISKELETELNLRANNCLKNEKYLDAEKLFVAVGQPDKAITMYADARQFEDMLRLVTQFHPNHLVPSYQHVAEELRGEKNSKGAEIYYLKAGQYHSALEMYMEQNLFEDALRISRSHGPPDTTKAVVYKWAITLGADLGYKLLSRHDLLDDCLIFYCDKREFDFALAIANLMGRDKVSGVLKLQAKHAEDQGNVEFAVKCFLDADDPSGAMNIYIKHQEFQKAISLAEEYCPSELETAQVSYGEFLFESQSYPEFESILLRADRVDIIIQMYQERGMWSEAFRICKQYAPNLMPELQEAYDASEVESSGPLHSRDSGKIISRAQEYERYGQNEKAIELYLQLNTNNTKEPSVLLNYWKRATELGIKFLDESDAKAVVSRICPNLTAMGKFREAASLCLEANMVQEGLEILMAGGHFEEAEEMASEMGPEVQEYVNSRHTKWLKDSGSLEQLTHVNLDAALEILLEKGDWSQLLEKAKGNSTSYSFYLGKYAMHTIEEKEPLKAVKIYYGEGVPMVHSHVKIIQSLALAFLNEPDLDDYKNNVMVRDMLFQYVSVLFDLSLTLTKMKQLESNNAEIEIEEFEDLDRLLFVLHLYTNRSVMREIKGFEGICTKISISLLRYGDTIPIERAYFDAGIYCKDLRWNNMALVFLNRYLDIFDAVEEGRSSTSALDSSSIAETDIPAFCTLPSQHTVSQDEHEEAKEWVLSAATDKTIVEELRLDERGVYEASLVNGVTQLQPCLISGYPVILSNASVFENGRQVNKDDWQKFVRTLRNGSNKEISAISKFITKWCGTNSSFSM